MQDKDSEALRNQRRRRKRIARMKHTIIAIIAGWIIYCITFLYFSKKKAQKNRMIFLHFFMYFLNFYDSPAKSPVTTAPTLNSITPQAMTAGDVPRSGIFPNMATGDAASSPKIAQ